MISEIFDMIEERRLAKRNIQKYNYIRDIHHKVRTIKNTWLVKQDREAEELLLNDAFYFHKKLKEITNKEQASQKLSKTTRF